MRLNVLVPTTCNIPASDKFYAERAHNLRWLLKSVLKFQLPGFLENTTTATEGILGQLAVSKIFLLNATETHSKAKYNDLKDELNRTCRHYKKHSRVALFSHINIRTPSIISIISYHI